MNLQKLFEAQKALDERIVREHGLEGQDLLQNKILALLVELGELANEWRGFKYWSKDQEPRNHIPQYKWIEGLNRVSGYKNLLLEEYVDCLHFFLSIGLGIGIITKIENVKLGFSVDTVLKLLFSDIVELEKPIDWRYAFNRFVHLGKELGFTWEQVEEAYFAKNQINHQRQEEGY